MRDSTAMSTNAHANAEHPESSEGAVSLQPRNGVLVLTGYGVRVAVNQGHLIVSDGTGRQRRYRRLHRATAKLKRLVLIGHSGTVSLDALRWIHDVGASFVQLDSDGEVVVASGPSGLDDARLRRAQALAACNGVGITIARDLLRTKLEGQADVLSRFPESQPAITIVKAAIQELDHADTLARLRSVEGKAAIAYWSAWAPVEMRFARKDQAKVPDHWRSFDTRSSPLTGGPRSASNPINALLNYAYAILETEVKLAVLTMGLDPGMGVMHADQKSRDSFVFDVIEPLRPVVDGYLLTMLHERTFAAREFFETRQGVCRLVPPLPKALGEMSPEFGKLAGLVVEQVAQRLAQGKGAKMEPITIPTLLTQSNRSAGRDRVRTKPQRPSIPDKPRLPAACRECGVILEDPTRQYCEICFPDYRDEEVATFSAGGRAKLAELRAAGGDPAHGADAAKKRGAKVRQSKQEQAAWEAEHGAEADPAVFQREILPHLHDVPLSVMARATGLSEQYCSFIRRGVKTPHQRHWDTLVGLETRRHTIS